MSECSLIRVVYSQYAIPAIYSIGLCLMIFAAYKYILMHIRGGNGVPQSTRTSRTRTTLLFHLSLAYYTILMLYILDIIVQNAYDCRPETVISYIRAMNLPFYLYFVQGLLLLLILFLKLVSIFVGTAHAVPQNAVLITAVVIVSDAVLYIITCSLLLYSTQWQFVWVSLWAFSGFIGICMIVGVNVLFMRKLSIVHASCLQAAVNQNGLLIVITKTAILCFMSTFTSILDISFLFIYRYAAGRGYKEHFRFIFALLLLLDLGTNFLCVLLATKGFDQWYYSLCQCCHRQMMEYCKARAGNTQVEMHMVQPQLQIVTSTSDVEFAE